MSLHCGWKVVLVSCHVSYFELATLSKTSSAMRRLVSHVVSSRVVEVMDRWFVTQDGFWSVLEDTRAVIGGSVVLRVLDDPRHLWTPLSLDIYVRNYVDDRFAIQALLAEHGYNDWEITHYAQQSRRRADGRLAWGKTVVTQSVYEAVDGDRIVRIFVVDHIDPLAAIPFTWSSAFVNAITSDYLLCAYPKATLSRKGIIRPDAWSDVCFESLHALSEEGFNTRTWGAGHSDGDIIPENTIYSLDAMRSFGDPQVLVFDQDASVLSDEPLFGTFARTRSMLACWQYGG